MDKFISFSAPRSGSTVVGLSLFKHPEVLYYNELFHPNINRRIDESSRKTVGLSVINLTKEHRYSFKCCSINDSGYEYLSDFYSKNAPFKSIGFKIKNYNALSGKNKDAWKYIAEHPEIKIVNICRENMLEKVCAFERGKRCNYWHITKPEKTHPFVLSVEKCRRHIQTMKIRDSAIAKIRETHKILNLEYEQICSDFQGSMIRVFEFIGVRCTRAPLDD